MEAIPAYWHAPHNVGDALTPWIIEKISGRPVRKVQHNRPVPKYFVTGSILILANGFCTVWGAGIAWAHARIRSDAKILAVRGPLSRDRARAGGAHCPDVLGDPALLLPRLYKPNTELPRRAVGVVPHLVDFELARRRYSGSDVLVIDVRDGPERVIDQIFSCERIVSSSLHGLIIATAYGAACRWAEFSDKVIGDGTKFVDFFRSAGMEDQKPLDLRQTHLAGAALAAEVPPYEARFSTDALWDACPFKPAD